MYEDNDEVADPHGADVEPAVADVDGEEDDVAGMAIGPSLRGGLLDLSLGKPIDTSARSSLTESELRRLGGG